MTGDNHRVDATPNPNPEPDPQGVGPWNMPLTVCPTPDMARPTTSAGPAFEDGTLGPVGPP